LRWHLARIGVDPDSGPQAEDLILALRERVHTLAEMAERARVWFDSLTTYDDAAVTKHLTAAARVPLQAAHNALAGVTAWNALAVHDALNAAAQSLGLGLGKVAQPLRVAITGTQVSPSIDHTVYLAGQSEALKRIDAALAKLPA
jgi:glutamyl-tRNA synthetase